MEIHERIGPYRLLDRLGSGGMGEVYLARAPDGTLLAVKTLRADLLARPGLRTRLRREAEAMSRVRGGNLAELLAHDLDAQPPYLAIRYVQGRSLRALVADEGPLPPAALWRLADGTARALAAVHRAGYLHRDLKPGNVMISDGEPVVIDFGISHALDETRLTRHGKASGTPAYMAPELLADGRCGPPGDIFAWAATLAYAATGRDAHWPGLGPAALARTLFAAENLSPALRDVLDAAFATDPLDRPGAEELLELLAPLAPVAGRDLHLDHPYEHLEGTVSLTLPGGRRVTLDVPSDAEAGETLAFPGQGGPGRNGGPAGALHLRLVPPAPSRTEPVVSPAPRGRRRRRAVLWAPGVILLAGLLGLFALQPFKESRSGGGTEVSDSGVRTSTKIYTEIPSACSVSNEEVVQRLLPGAKVPSAGGGSNGGRGNVCYIDGRELDPRRSLRVELSLLRATAYERFAQRGASSFEDLRSSVRRDPYSRDEYADFPLGDMAFSYVWAQNDDTVVAVNALVGNVIVRVEWSQDGGEFTPSAKNAVLAEVKELARRIVDDFPGRAVVASPSP